MFKDLFISYGRRESLNFVARLHRQLKLAGYDAWFDKVNIPDGEDYVERIKYGIESAHNFVYVMAPHSLRSPHCLLELEYARLLGKRIIPVNHMIFSKGDDKPLAAADGQILRAFYKEFDIPDPHLETTQQVFEHSLAVVGRTDWLDGKENIDEQECARLAEWAQSYENHWHKHDEIDFLRTVALPSFGKAVDTLDSIVERVSLILERHKAYVEQHTALLAHALAWSRQQFASHYLLVGKERTAAQSWLLTPFKDGEQAPCTPNDLLCDFISESRKNSENRMSDCFVCYGHSEKVARDAVIYALARHAVTTWRHDNDIQKGADYARAIETGIEGADNFLFFISPTSVKSDYCQRELEHALRYHKRIIPLLITPTDAVPEAICGLQHIDFTTYQVTRNKQNLQAGISTLLHILHQEADYYRHHKHLLVGALRWTRNGQKPSFLLRGHNLQNAQTWLRLNQERQQYQPTSEHHEFISISEASKGRLGTDVFISYSRKDGDFARKLNLALQEADKTVWFDQESIASGMDFEAELYKGIDSADNFVFVVSYDSVISEYCEDEVNYAVSQGKRILSVLARPTDTATLPEVLRVIHWVDFVEQPFDKAFAELVQAIDIDRDHVQQHTILQQRALEWRENKCSSDFLLNTSACENAERWRDKAFAEEKTPAPTHAQQSYIRQSRNAIKKADRRRNIIMGIFATMTCIAVGLSWFAWGQMKEAQQQRAQAQQQKLEAQQQKLAAQEQRAVAQAQKQIAEQHRDNALVGHARYLSEIARQNTQKGLVFSAMRLTLEALPGTSESHPHRPILYEAQLQLYNAAETHWRGVLEHENPLRGASFSPCGRQILTWAGDTAYIWDAHTRQLAYLLSGHASNLNYATFAPDGNVIVTVSDDSSVRLWQAGNGELLHVLKAHESYVNHAAFSPDGHWLVTTSYDNTARIWDVNDGALLHTLQGHDSIVIHAAFSPDSTQVATASYDNTARLWDANTGKSLQLFSGHQGYVLQAEFSPDGKTVATISDDNTARLWDVRRGRELRVLKDHQRKLNHVAFSADGKMLVTTANDNTARLWDVSKERVLFVLRGHGNAVIDASFSPDGKRVLTTSADNTARVWDINNGELLQLLQAHTAEVRRAAFAPDGKTIVTASVDNTARICDAVHGLPLHILSGHQGALKHAAFAPDGKAVATASTDNTVRLWDTTNGLPVHTLAGHEAAVRYVTFAPDGKTLVTASEDNTARIWDRRSGELVHVLSGHEGDVYHASFCPAGQGVLTASLDHTARLWDTALGVPVYVLRGHEGIVIHTAFAPDASVIVTASYDHSARLWDAANGDLLYVLKGHEGVVYYADFAPDAKTLVTASFDNTARIWDVATGETLHILRGHIASVRDAQFSPDGQYIVTTSDDYTARLWNAATGEVLHVLKGHEGLIYHADFSPDGKAIITASYDGSARLWDTTTGHHMLTLTGHNGPVNYAAFSYDAKAVITVSEDKSARLWPLFTRLEDLVAYARQVLPLREDGTPGFRLTCKERDAYFLDKVPRCETPPQEEERPFEG
jgi:WD40 repeat protein